MASPQMARGAKSRANLKRGGIEKHRKTPKAVSDESRKLSRKLLSDPQYRKTLKKRLREGTIQPGVEALLYYYAYGKPKETLETTTPTAVTIKHVYADDPPVRKKPAPEKPE